MIALSACAYGHPSVAARLGDGPKTPAEAMSRLRTAIADQSPEEVLALVHDGGLQCADSLVPKSQVRVDLSTKGSLVHDLLFDAKSYEKTHQSLARPFALATVFEAGGGTVSGTQGSGADVCFRVGREGLTGSVEVCFTPIDGGWYLGESLYACPD